MAKTEVHIGGRDGPVKSQAILTATVLRNSDGSTSMHLGTTGDGEAREFIDTFLEAMQDLMKDEPDFEVKR